MNVPLRLGLLLGASLFFLGACNSGDDFVAESRTCNEAPGLCGAGTTCWLNAQMAYECLPSGRGKLGESCQYIFATPTCRDGLVCLMLSGENDGKCLSTCGLKNAAPSCTGQRVCTTISFPEAASFSTCIAY